MTQNKTFQILGALAGLALGFGLFSALLFWMEDKSAHWVSLLHNFSIFGFLGILILSHFLMLCGARKWAVLSHALDGVAGREPKVGFFLRHYLWQNWIGQFVPPTFAIVLGRGFAARRLATCGFAVSEPTSNSPTQVGVRGGLYSGLLDQAMEFALLVGMIPAGAMFLWAHVSVGIFFLLSVLGIIAAIGGIYAMAFLFQKKLLPFILPLLVWSVVRVFLIIVRLVLGSMTLGLMLDPLAIIAAMPMVSLFALLPLTPGNLGIIEWGWVGVMASAGSDPVQVGLYAIGFRALVLAAQTLLVWVHEFRLYFRT